MEFSLSFPRRGRPRRVISAAAGVLPVQAEQPARGPRCRRKARTPPTRGFRRCRRSPGKPAARTSSGGTWHLDHAHVPMRLCRTRGPLDEAGSLSLGCSASTSIHRIFNSQGSEMMVSIGSRRMDPSKEPRKVDTEAVPRGGPPDRADMPGRRFMSARIGPIVPRSSF